MRSATYCPIWIAAGASPGTGCPVAGSFTLAASPRTNTLGCPGTDRSGPTITRPEHARHALEIMLAAQAAGLDGVARCIESDFPAPAYDEEWITAGAHRLHDPRGDDGV